MYNWLKNYILYGGTDKGNFERIRSKVQKANLIMVTILSAFATLLITIMFISSFTSEGVKQNRNVYLVGIIMSVLILLLSTTLAKKCLQMTTSLIYLSYMIYYLYGILIGVITDPEGKTVTFMVLLVFMPILFITRPLHVVVSTIAYVSIFILLCLQSKEGAVLSVDILDAIIFGILGVASGSVINRMKIKSYILEQKLQEISRIDQLTQTRNRNAFEVELDTITDICKHTLGCLYVDVNGLHEINNENGHEFGDKMLKFVASKIKDTFSADLTYRVGGDEFVVFIPDKEREEIEIMICDMKDEIEKENYYIAVGYEVEKIRHLSIDKLIQTAEGRMFRDKKMYYKNIANRDIRNKK